MSVRTHDKFLYTYISIHVVSSAFFSLQFWKVTALRVLDNAIHELLDID